MKRGHQREHGRVRERQAEVLVAQQVDVVVQPDEVLGRGDELPVEEAHQDGLTRRDDPQVDEQRHDRRQREEHEPVSEPGPVRRSPDGFQGVDQPITR